MGRNLIDLTNTRVPGTRLTVKKRLPNDENGRVQWFCICDCGNSKVATSNNLKQGYVKSCGCLHSELSSKRLKKQHKQRRMGCNATQK